MHQPEQPVPHLAIRPGKYARQERTGQEECCQPDQQRSGPRLHHAMELRHRRDMDTAHPQCQRRSLCVAGCQRDSNGKSQSGVHTGLPTARTILGRPARHQRPSICRRVCHDAFHPRTVHRERADEVGIAGSHHPLHIAVVGAQLHAVHRLLLGLYPPLCQVPYRGLDIGHCRIYHPAAGHDGPQAHRG